VPKTSKPKLLRASNRVSRAFRQSDPPAYTAESTPYGVRLRLARPGDHPCDGTPGNPSSGAQRTQS
jgi:hypothetical protein